MATSILAGASAYRTALEIDPSMKAARDSLDRLSRAKR